MGESPYKEAVIFTVQHSMFFVCCDNFSFPTYISERIMPKQVKIGDKASVTKAFTEDDVKQFAEISRDKNPIHLDAEYAKNTMFKQRVVHGALVASLFSGVIGMELPGEGTIAMGQSIKFLRPVFIGDEVTATVEVAAIAEGKPIVTLKVTGTNTRGEVVIEGEATVRV